MTDWDHQKIEKDVGKYYCHIGVIENAAEH